MNYARVNEVMPALAHELREQLETTGRSDLAAKVDELLIVDRCRCGDDFCSTFYTGPPPDGAYASQDD